MPAFAAPALLPSYVVVVWGALDAGGVWQGSGGRVFEDFRGVGARSWSHGAETPPMRWAPAVMPPKGGCRGLPHRGPWAPLTNEGRDARSHVGPAPVHETDPDSPLTNVALGQLVYFSMGEGVGWPSQDASVHLRDPTFVRGGTRGGTS